MPLVQVGPEQHPKIGAHRVERRVLFARTHHIGGEPQIVDRAERAVKIEEALALDAEQRLLEAGLITEIPGVVQFDVGLVELLHVARELADIRAAIYGAAKPVGRLAFVGRLWNTDIGETVLLRTAVGLKGER